MNDGNKTMLILLIFRKRNKVLSERTTGIINNQALFGQMGGETHYGSPGLSNLLTWSNGLARSLRFEV